jgi:hypothetical protein
MNFYPNPDELTANHIMYLNCQYFSFKSLILIFCSFSKGKKCTAIVVAASVIAYHIHCFRLLVGLALRRRSHMCRTFLSSPTPFARRGLSRRLLSEPCLDAALHDVLLHLLSQIPDHMPCIDSFPVLLLLPSTQNIYSRVYNIHILDNNFLWKMKYAQTR